MKVDTSPKPVMLYDGVCGLCNRGVQFVLRHDRRKIFRFASLQSAWAEHALARHGVRAADLDSVYVIAGSPEAETLLARSDAVIFMLRELGGAWRFAGNVLKFVPKPIREWKYRLVARYRYRVFGRYDACPLPDAATRERFVDVADRGTGGNEIS